MRAFSLHPQHVSHVFQVVDAIHVADEIIFVQFELGFPINVDLDVVAFERGLAVRGRSYVEFTKISSFRAAAKQDLDFARSVFAAFRIIAPHRADRGKVLYSPPGGADLSR